MARVVALVAAVVVTACGALGCATTPAFSANAVEPATPGGAFELRFELVNRTNDRQTLSIGAESIHIESVTRDGKAVAPEQKDVTPPENPIPQRGETLPIVEPDGVVAFFTRGGLSDLVLTGDVWHRRVFPLEHGHYRVTFSYQYRGTADGKPNLFTGRLVDKVRFDIE